MGVISDDDEWGLNDLLDERDREPQHVMSADDLAAVERSLDALISDDKKRKSVTSDPIETTPIEPKTSFSVKPLSVPAPVAEEVAPIVEGLLPSPTLPSPTLLDLIKENAARFPQPNLHPLRKQHPNQTIHLRWGGLKPIEKLGWMHTFLGRYEYHSTLNLDLDHDAEARALKSPNPRDHIFRAIQRTLKRASLNCVLIIVAERCEVTDPAEQARRVAKGLPPNLRLHVHGELGCALEAVPDVAEALCKAAGKWHAAKWTPRNRQLVLRRNPNLGWLRGYGERTGYATKESQCYSVTADLRAQTEKWYEEFRIGLNEKRRAKALGSRLPRSMPD